MSNEDEFDIEAPAELISADAQLTIVRYRPTSWNTIFPLTAVGMYAFSYDHGTRGVNIASFLTMFVATLPYTTARPDLQIRCDLDARKPSTISYMCAHVDPEHHRGT
jgi:hypothetical protein